MDKYCTGNDMLKPVINHIILGELTLVQTDSIDPKFEGNVHMLDAVIFLDQTCAFEGCMVRYGSTNN